jgi:hypothetical protein
LLDLGEHKGWTEANHSAALSEAAAWMVSELSLPAEVEVPPGLPQQVDLGALRDLGARLPVEPSPGMARWICGLAPALGTAPKTVANGLAGTLRANRSDHRWLALFARVLAGGAAPDAWFFHRRTPAAVAAECSRMVRAAPLDAGDAMLVLSLLALWQRRRPTEQARGNRGAPAGRRATPKPIAALCGVLLQPGQIDPLARVARAIGGERSQHLLGLVLEAALTEAHLAPHPPRRGSVVGRGEALLCAVDRALDVADGTLTAEDLEIFRFRILRMRAWRDRAKSPSPAPSVCPPHVAASLWLQGAMPPNAPPYEVSASTPGLMMLLPQLRSRGVTVLP